MRWTRRKPHHGAMSSPLLIPLEGGFGHHGPFAGPGGANSEPRLGALAPFGHLMGDAMFFLFLLLLLGGLFLLARRGRIGLPPWLAQRSPESEARRILAERFARGDMSSDDFMERASVLNWTPGSDIWEHSSGKKRRR